MASPGEGRGNPDGAAIPAATQRVPIEAVQLCIDNALRLLEDSDGVSEPTRAALLELSLEEIAKGWVLLVRLSDYGKNVLSADQLIKSAFGEEVPEPYKHHLGSVAAYFQKEVAGKTPELNEIFGVPGSHRRKLEFVGRLLDWSRLILSGPSEGASGNVNSTFFLGPAFTARRNPEARVLLEDALDSLNTSALNALAAIKEGGFYVDRTPGGMYVSPTSLGLPDLDELEVVTEFLLDLLKLNFLVYVRVTGHSPR